MSKEPTLSNYLRAIENSRYSKDSRGDLTTEDVSTAEKITWALESAGGIVSPEAKENTSQAKQRLHVYIKNINGSGLNLAFTFAADNSGNVNISRYQGVRMAAGILADHLPHEENIASETSTEQTAEIT